MASISIPTMTQRCFDVIFSGRTLQTNTELRDILRDQENGSTEYVHEVVARVKGLRERIEQTVGPALVTSFGLNTTSSIAMMLPLLPGVVVSGVKEFPPVVHAVEALGSRWTGLIDSERGRYLPVTNEGLTDDEYLLLVSHVAYTDGEDLLHEGLEVALQDAPHLRNRQAHMLVDGAHALGNHFFLQDLLVLHQRCASMLNLASFTYVFDFHKWIQGVMGMSVVVTTNPALLRALDWVFPNNLTFDNDIMDFEPPCSVSFNPVLAFWLLNLRNFADRLFDVGLGERNKKLTKCFLAGFDDTRAIGLGRHRTNNLLSVETSEPAELHAHLQGLGFRTHLIGGRTLRGRDWRLHLDGSVRLAFRDGLVVEKDIERLIQTLMTWLPAEERNL